MSVHRWILRSLLASPMREAVVDDQRRWKSIEIVVAAAHLASYIERTTKTKTVGVMLPTSGFFPIAALAAWWTGRVVVPLNYLLKEEELQYVVSHCGADTIISVTPMLDVAPTPKHVRLALLDEMDFSGAPDPRWPASAGRDDLAALLYTSGTSGRPKGVMLSHGAITANIRQCEEHVAFTRRDSLLGVLPQFHSFGFTVLTMLPLALRLRAVFSARFIPQKIVRLIAKEKPTVLIAIPSMYNALLAVKKATADDLASLRLCVSGAEPLPDDVAQRFVDRFGIRINEGYGLTETAPVTNLCRPFEFAPGTVGAPVPRVHERIVDVESGVDLPAGREGEIRIKGPNVMQGYFHRPPETRAVFDGKGYFRTGDMGRLDEQGRLYVTGRIKEMLIIGGENVFPREIEETLNRHPSVSASGVVGTPDPMRGETPTAFVEIVEGQTFDEASLRSWCRERLAGYKAPREIIRVDSLPRNGAGKILRRELREAALARLAHEKAARGAHAPEEGTAEPPTQARNVLAVHANTGNAQERTRTSTPNNRD